MVRFVKPAFIALVFITLLALIGCQHQAAVLPSLLPISPTLTPFQPLLPAATAPPAPTEVDLPANTAEPIAAEGEESLTAEADEPLEVNSDAAQAEVVAAGEVTVPVLLYHHVSDTIDTQYSVSTAALNEQMAWLYNNGYTTLTVSDLAHLIREGGAVPQRPIVITFDDGYYDVYENAYPILEQYGYFATFFIIGETVDARGNLSAQQLKEMMADGWEIGSHSMHHIDLNEGYNWHEEIVSSKSLLENKLGVEIETFAYPYGLADSGVIDYTINAGYTSAVGLGSEVTHYSSTLYYLSRKEVKSWYGLDFFADFLPWSN
ncbi:MAG: polysaccharide deacetylase family protein [Anaerolineaceae bacterium]|nr:polysaccharide deacetylase family protein [Anaerolineaceae bacterium]